MAFRFPHPFENVVDAIKDALDPDTPADGSLVTQLMNENNRAIEDAIVPALPFSGFSAIRTIDQTGGTLSASWSSLSNVTLIGSGLSEGILPSDVGFYAVSSSWVITGTPGDLLEPSIGSGIPASYSCQVLIRPGTTGAGSSGGLVVAGPPTGGIYAGIQYDTVADWVAVVKVVGYLVESVG